MKRLCGVLFLFYSVGSDMYAQHLSDSIHHALISEGIDLTLRQNYEAADSIFKIVSKRFPDHPSGYMYQAAVLQTRSMDFVLPLHREVFDSLLEIAENLSDALISTTPDSPWGYYYLATARGYDAFARVERGDWFGGFRIGLSAASQFKTCIKKDPLFYDAFAGLGTYYYWKSRKIEFLNWLPFISDDRSEGIRLLQQCSKLGSYNRFVALSALVRIFVDAGQFQQSEEAAREALSSYPMNRLFLWGLSGGFWKAGKKQEAAETYATLLNSIVTDRIPNPYPELLCRLNIVSLQLALGDSAGVDAHLQLLLSFESYDFPEDLKPKAMAKFEEARNIRSLLKNHRVSGN